MKVLSSQMLLEILNHYSLTLEGRSHKINLRSGRIAQLGERRPYKPEVAGSIPVPPTMCVLLKAKRMMSLELIFTSSKNYFYLKEFDSELRTRHSELIKGA